VFGLSLASKKRRRPLPEALVQMEALLRAASEEEAMAQPAPAVVGAASTASQPLVSSRGVNPNLYPMPPFSNANAPYS